MSQSFIPPIAALFVLAGAISGQPSATRPGFDQFEVAAIKPAPPDAAGRWIRMQSAHEFMARNHALHTLIAAAYNLNPRAISGGPAWVDSDHYDIVAKAPNEVRPNLDEQMAMLRKLLAQRFHLIFHREERELQVYELTIAKGGPKMKKSTLSPDASPEGSPPLIFVVSPQLVRLPGRNAAMADLASVMQRSALDYPVLDKTGLPGRYDFDLEFAPDEAVFGGVLGKGPDDPTKPDLFAAISQQLGLRLAAAKGPVEALIIDHVERPSEN